MPYSDELNREYTDEEARFWRELQFAVKNTPGAVRPEDVAQGQGIDKRQMVQYLRTWDNDGLLRFFEGATYRVSLTEFGRQFTFEGRYGDIENA